MIFTLGLGVTYLISKRGPVKAHSDDIYNNMADALAKQGADSDVKGCPNLFTLSPINYIPNFSFIPIETNIKHFINEPLSEPFVIESL